MSTFEPCRRCRAPVETSSFNAGDCFYWPEFCAPIELDAVAIDLLYWHYKKLLPKEEGLLCQWCLADALRDIVKDRYFVWVGRFWGDLLWDLKHNSIFTPWRWRATRRRLKDRVKELIAEIANP